MGFWDSVSRFAQTASRALPPCHICGAPGAQVCIECHQVACHRHAYSNIGAVKSACSSCMAVHFPWAVEDLHAVGPEMPSDWPYNETPWQILGIDPDASAEAIRKAQRELSKAFHPDKQGDKERQVAVNRAAEEMLRMRQAA